MVTFAECFADEIAWFKRWRLFLIFYSSMTIWTGAYYHERWHLVVWQDSSFRPVYPADDAWLVAPCWPWYWFGRVCLYTTTWAELPANTPKP